jgi:hypothetical protein
MSRRSILLSAGLLVLTSACSGPSGTSTGDPDGFDAEAGTTVTSDDGTDAGESSSDASGSVESGTAPGAADTGTAQERDAGSEQVTCAQLALGVCQTAVVSTDAAAAWRAQCTGQGGSTTTACPTSGLVGCCVGDTAHFCYYSNDYTASTAQQGCSIMNGTWSTSM